MQRSTTENTDDAYRQPAAAGELTRLYARRARGEAVDPAVLERSRAAGAALASCRSSSMPASTSAITASSSAKASSSISAIASAASAAPGSARRAAISSVIRCSRRRCRASSPARTRSSNFAAAQGDRRDPLSRPRPGRGRMPRFPRGRWTEIRARLRRAVPDARPRRASSPSAVLNEHYDSEEAYLAALAAALQVEYEAIVGAGFLLQLDAPISRSSVMSPTRTGRSADFLDIRRARRRGDQHGARQHTARPGADACLLGQLRGAARLRRAARRHLAGAAAGQGRRLRPALRQSAARP